MSQVSPTYHRAVERIGGPNRSPTAVLAGPLLFAVSLLAPVGTAWRVADAPPE